MISVDSREDFLYRSVLRYLAQATKQKRICGSCLCRDSLFKVSE